MASYSKREGAWRAQVAIMGARQSKSFATKAQAVAWATQLEADLRNNLATGTVHGKTLEDACRRYEKEVSPTKRGHQWEVKRLTWMCDYQVFGKRLGDYELVDITPEVLGKFRDMRLAGTPEWRAVTGSTFNRDLNLLSNVFHTAVKEWQWIVQSPTRNVRRPKESPSRDRLISDDEIERINVNLGFDFQPVTTKKQAAGAAFLFAIETAMRQAEICSLTNKSIKGRVAHLDSTKNGSERDVPLSKVAREILACLPAQEKDDVPLFLQTPPRLSAIFAKATAQCLIENLTFHDTRHEAITRLAKKLNVLDLARMVGHKDLRMLQIYYNETAENMADRLD